MYGIIFNFGFLLTNVTGKLFALDLLLGIGPILFNIVYLSVPKDCRFSMIPNGWPNIIFLVCTLIIGLFFAGFIVYYIADCFAIKSHNLACDGDYCSKQFSLVNWALDIFMIVFYIVQCVMMYTFVAYSLEFKKDYTQRKLIKKIKEMKEGEAKILD
jgi:hypothetical protein